MKIKSLIVGIIAALLVVLPSLAGGTHSTKGYTKKDGTFVAPHRQTNPDKSKSNNWSSKGNTNPDTGKKGTKDPNAPTKKK